MERYKLSFFDNQNFVENSVLEPDFETKSVSEIIISIKKQAFELQTEEELTLFIQNNQRTLLQFIREEQINKNLEKVLYFLESHFPKYINADLPASQLTIQEFLKEYVKKIQLFENSLQEKLDTELMKIVKPVCEPQHIQIFTCHHKIYLSVFWDVLHGSYVRAGDVSNHDFVNFLLQTNYNSLPFFNYYTNLVIKETALEETIEFKLAILNQHLRKIKTVYPLIDHKLSSRAPDISQLLENWLSIEIRQCKSIVKSFNPAQSRIDFVEQSKKINLSLSVAQIGFLIQLFQQMGIITNSSPTEILQILSRFISSKNQPDISFVSLHNKFYNATDSTKESVKSLLMQVAKNI